MAQAVIHWGLRNALGISVGRAPKAADSPVRGSLIRGLVLDPGAVLSLQHRPYCGGDLKIIAVILERPVIEMILTHLGLDPQPPPRGRAREAGQDFAT